MPLALRFAGSVHFVRQEPDHERSNPTRLCFSVPALTCVFATAMSDTLLPTKRAFPEVSAALDPVRVGDFLEFLTFDQEATFYEGVKRIPPGHMLTVEDGRVRYHGPLHDELARHSPALAPA